MKAHAARLGFFYKNSLYKFTVIIIDTPLWFDAKVKQEAIINICKF